MIDPRLIVALDLDGTAEAERLVARLGSGVGFYKIGYRLAYRGGLELARDLARDGHRVFLDLKLHDIGSTVGHGVEAVAGLGATFLTVHAYPQTLRAAAEAARGSGLGILGVTVLTSYDEADLAEAGYALGVAGLVARRAGQAREAGAAGLVLSAAELGTVRPMAGGMALVTPGIRPAGAALGDQKRAAAPAEALAAGATHLVVGRPITGAPDPAEAAGTILAEMAQTAPSHAAEA